MDRKSLPIAAVMAAALLVSLALAGQASAYVYWADSQNDRIGRAENDGSGVNPNFIQTGDEPTAVAVDSGHIYWANESGGSIGRANIDGSGVDNSFITGLGQPGGVAVNASSIYWSDFSGFVGKANLNGTNPVKNFISDPDGPTGVALDSGHVYWSAFGGGTPAFIGRAGLDGGSKQPNFVTITVAVPRGVAVNSANIYWADFGFIGPGTRIGRASTFDGKGVDESFIGGASAPCGLTLFSSQLYWANANTNMIARANSDGTAVNQEFSATGGSQICGVAVDNLSTPPPPPSGGSRTGGGNGGGGSVPDTVPPAITITKGPGKKLPQGKAKFSFRSNEPGSHFVCKLDRSKPNPCTSPKTYKALKPGKHTFKVWAIDPAGNKATKPAKRTFKVPV